MGRGGGGGGGGCGRPASQSMAPILSLSQRATAAPPRRPSRLRSVICRLRRYTSVMLQAGGEPAARSSCTHMGTCHSL